MVTGLVKKWLHIHQFKPTGDNASGVYFKGNEPEGLSTFQGVGALEGCFCGLRAIRFEGLPSLGVIEE
jgi:hypothetical protein